MSASSCSSNSDNQFGPRVDTACRSFDFTLFFEDIFFSILPSTIFLLLLLPRFEILRRTPVKLSSIKLAIYKEVETCICPWTKYLWSLTWLTEYFGHSSSPTNYFRGISPSDVSAADQDINTIGSARRDFNSRSTHTVLFRGSALGQAVWHSDSVFLDLDHCIHSPATHALSDFSWGGSSGTLHKHLCSYSSSCHLRIGKENKNHPPLIQGCGSWADLRVLGPESIFLDPAIVSKCI